jgi:hypothetical protein
MLVTLRLMDVDEDDAAQLKLRELSVIVIFGVIDNHGNMTFPASYMEYMPPVILTTYVRVDESSG